jgi:chromosome segregation ATPase
MARDALFVENQRLKEQLKNALSDLSSKVALLEEKNKTIKKQDKTIEEKEAVINKLSEKVRLLEILHFGSKSEKWTKHDDQQARLFNEAEDEAFKQNAAAMQKAVVETIELGGYTRRKSGSTRDRAGSRSRLIYPGKMWFTILMNQKKFVPVDVRKR